MLMKLRCTLGVCALLSIAGCNGIVTGDDGSGGGDPHASGAQLQLPSMHRLTSSQYRNSVRDVLGVEVPADLELEPDVAVNGLVAIGAAKTTISPRGVELYESAALEVAHLAFADSSHRDSLVSCAPVAEVDADCAADVIRSIGLRAWRRPLSDDEVERYVTVATAAAEALGSFDEGLELAVAGLLQSPNFLFRIETGVPDPNDSTRRRFTSYEMAERLSYLLWNTTPDAELLEAAAKDELVEVDGLVAQAERLLDSPRSRDGVRSFFDDLFGLQSLLKLTKDPALFPDGVSPATFGASAREETLSVLERIVFDEDVDFREMFVTRATYVNSELAVLYDVEPPAQAGFVPVDLPASDGREGLLGQASFLALNAHSKSTSPTRRGKAIREMFLCQAIPAPPPNVDATPPDVSTAPTARERLEIHRTDPSCNGCHRMMDPLGLSLEHFDAIGRWRDTENDASIDVSGELDGIAFDDATGLSQALHDREDVANCLVRKYFSYATGYPPRSGEESLFNSEINDFRDSGYRVKPLLIALITSDGFRGAALAE